MGPWIVTGFLRGLCPTVREDRRGSPISVDADALDLVVPVHDVPGNAQVLTGLADRTALELGIHGDRGVRDVSALLGGLADEAASRGAEFITVFYGEDVAEEDAHKACDAFTRKCPDAEVNLICGGQPVYYYMISVE